MSAIQNGPVRRLMYGLVMVLSALCTGACSRTILVGATEDGEVLDVIYMPSRHGAGFGPSVGVDTDGGVASGVSIVSVDMPSKFAVVFKCQHGKFVVQSEGDESRAHQLWKKLTQGMRVTIAYQEEYRENSQGRQFVKYHFVDAIPK
jgi:hypothetical protein